MDQGIAATKRPEEANTASRPSRYRPPSGQGSCGLRNPAEQDLAGRSLDVSRTMISRNS